MDKLFFPLIFIMASVTQPGVQFERGSVPGYYPYIVDGGYVKYTIDWYLVETIPGVYDWSLYDNDMSYFDNERVLLSIRNAPEWHRIDKELHCSDVLSSSYDDYLTFLKAVIERYNPDSIELFNEPDIYPSPYPTLFGCFKDVNNYVSMMTYVCSDLQKTYPLTDVFAGALAYVGDFAKKLPENVCDGISMHYYVYAGNNGSDWAKLQNDINLLHSWGHERIWLSETSLLDAETEEQMTLQAEYFLYLKYDVVGIERFYWYTVGGNGWRFSDLIQKGIFKPVWFAYKENYYYQKK